MQSRGPHRRSETAVAVLALERARWSTPRIKVFFSAKTRNLTPSTHCLSVRQNHLSAPRALQSSAGARKKPPVGGLTFLVSYKKSTDDVSSVSNFLHLCKTVTTDQPCFCDIGTGCIRYIRYIRLRLYCLCLQVIITSGMGYNYYKGWQTAPV